MYKISPVMRRIRLWLWCAGILYLCTSSTAFANAIQAYKYSSGIGSYVGPLAFWTEKDACADLDGRGYGSGYVPGGYQASYGSDVCTNGTNTVTISQAGPYSIDTLADKGVGGIGCACVGNPINPGTGNKYQTERDYIGSGPFPLQFFRTYNGMTPLISLYQWNHWRNNYERSISVMSASAVYVRRADAKGVFFSVTNGMWVSDADVSDQLSQLKDSGGNLVGWKYVNVDDEVERYDPSGKLISITDRFGITQTLIYSDSSTPSTIAPVPGLLIRVDSLGRQLNFTYDKVRHVATMTDPAGGLYQYGYDANGNLTSVTYPDGKIRTYLYNEPAHTQNTNFPYALTGLIDENNGRFASWNYDPQGRAISSEADSIPKCNGV